MEQKIDFVVLWLDSNDPKWQKDYATYSPQAKEGKGNVRFRDHDTFRYWFRAVEKYAPWVHKVFLVTNGKFPDWINRDCQRLELVEHADYIPQEMLPTFNSSVIEVFLNRIKGLSEQFVYFNDDMFLNAPVSPNYYFKNGLPCDCNKESCLNVPIYTKEDKFGICFNMMTCIGLVNGHFNRWRTVCQSPRRWFGPHLGLTGLLMSCMLAKQRLFVGFTNYHVEQAFLKSTLNEVWESEGEFISGSCTRFRSPVQPIQYLFRYWQFASNTFYPMKRNRAFFFLSNREVLKDMEKTMKEEKCVSLCLNDSAFCTDEDYEYLREELPRLFERKFPQKSAFEL
ncbi:MAG: capsule biosynthesis protein CapK [Prevotella sp.]|nr:capsule biosynthesis protein CapK [Prevotella sp.]